MVWRPADEKRMIPPRFDPPFVPARECRWVLWIACRLASAVLRWREGVGRVTLRAEDWERLRALRRERLILCANHPGGTEPILAFWLATRLGTRFHYLAARDIFTSWRAWLLPRLGCYSVRRGYADRESIRETMRLLAEADARVVIFPEGEIYQLNDRMLPFQSGVVTLGFWALIRLRELGKPLRLPLVPVAIKYRCLDAAERPVRESLSRLERALSLPDGADLAPYPRLARVGERLVAAVEEELVLPPPGETSLPERIAAVKERLLARIASALGVRPFPGDTFVERLRAAYNALHDFAVEYADARNDYERRQHLRRQEQVHPIYEDWSRLYRFVAVSGDYVAERMTAERFLELLDRLETEVLGRRVVSWRREALVRVGEPLDLAAHLADYERDRHGTIQAITAELEARIGGMLQELAASGTPLGGAGAKSVGHCGTE